jgi:hypothetical protein
MLANALFVVGRGGVLDRERVRAAADPGAGVPYLHMDTSDWWVSDVRSPVYNRHQRCAPGTCPFGRVYDYALVMGVDQLRAPGGGSAFFLDVTETSRSGVASPSRPPHTVFLGVSGSSSEPEDDGGDGESRVVVGGAFGVAGGRSRNRLSRLKQRSAPMRCLWSRRRRRVGRPPREPLAARRVIWSSRSGLTKVIRRVRIAWLIEGSEYVPRSTSAQLPQNRVDCLLPSVRSGHPAVQSGRHLRRRGAGACGSSLSAAAR